LGSAWKNKPVSSQLALSLYSYPSLRGDNLHVQSVTVFAFTSAASVAAVTKQYQNKVFINDSSQVTLPFSNQAGIFCELHVIISNKGHVTPPMQIDSSN
jgi:hypothetical protein